jgi:membrane protein DedA with SNARE-associated domain/membrane-associated phospholipid phosphatase
VTELFQQLINWVALHPLWAEVIIFLVAMAESLAIVGLIVPGVVMMFGIGALIATGTLEFWPVFTAAVAGAVTGDGLSFWLGRRLQGKVSRIWPFSRHPAELERGIRFFERFGGKSVALGRFFGPVRAVIPLVAGTMGMSPGRFLVANILSAIAWAPAYLLPGIVLGASLELASQVAFRLVILLLLLILLIWFLVWAVRLVFRIVHPHATAWVQALLNWSRLHPSFTEIAEALADPHHPEAKGLAILTTLLILALGLFAFVLGSVLEGLGETGIDQTVFQAMQSLRAPWADHLMVNFTRLGEQAVILPLVAGVFLFLIWQRHWRPAVYWLAAAAFGLFVPIALKYGLQVPRPPSGVALHSYSFPSGHVLQALVTYGFLSIIIARAIRSNWRWIAYSFAAVLVLLVALSRLYLGVHWLSDVFGSLTLGLTWIALLGIAYHRHTKQESHWLGLSLLSLLLITGGVTWREVQRHSADIARYTPPVPISVVPAEEWWQRGWSRFPGARKDTRNRQNHPFNLQYAGSLEALRSELAGTGWEPATVLDFGNALKLLSPRLPLSQLPVLPQVDDGRHESLVLVKPENNGRNLVIRLWSAQTSLVPGHLPLWVGNVSEIRKATVLDLFVFPETGNDFATPFRQLLQDSRSLDQRQPTQEQDLLLLRQKTPAPPAGTR